ncbi:16S rRNA (cytosine(967)-C(5))-methyltransferase [hydrothermal vent metagenome]|uniref:16S rRNA (cytosine(967)-C(5))-methyltransferase n=1 Tax=hydrothermal vent metagenome TaxID=652676 RepID=A0A3B0ZK72_9ZZZZ
MNARVAAARAVKLVSWDGQSLSRVIPNVAASLDDAKEAPLLQEMAYGTLRWRLQLAAVATLLLQKPLKEKDADVHCILLVGLYQLFYMRTADHAAVSQTVDAVKLINKPWAAGLINGVLRQAQRSQDALLEQVNQQPHCRWSHPKWLIRRLKRDWPEHWQQILSQNNERPPMILRVNQQRTDRVSYLAELEQCGWAAALHDAAPEGIVLTQAVNVDQLPRFKEGAVAIQDGGAQLAAHLLDTAPEQRILDACAAPGGKTCHLLESQPKLHLVQALDIDEKRIGRVNENLQRLHLEAQLIVADAKQPELWWDGIQYDRILLDAPCSATGVIRRHPDIKSLRKASDIDALVKEQNKLLIALWPLLKVGGKLLYTTCSILMDENMQQMQTFLVNNKDAKEDVITAEWGHKMKVGRQILPGDQSMDGFYYARVVKV